MRVTGGVSYKQGIVAESRPGFARVRFDDLDGLVTAWLPVIQPKTFLDKAVWTLDVGEQVACVLDEYMESGCILGAVYSDVDTPPVSSADKIHLRFVDGTSMEYDRAGHKMLIHCIGDIKISADGHMALTAARIDLN
ncbi:MAG: phage baseplate assembly protein V [Candidatus Accumulibacter sp.]|jgi:phage baseplate assembly protein V|nr:phage baseplate assembly protein V [Accumulibacter sp.]